MNRFAIEDHPNKALVTVHFTSVLPEIGYCHGEDTAEAKVLRESLLRITGVTEVTSDKNSVRITRSGAYAWDKVESLVVSVVANYVGVDSFDRVELYAMSHEPTELLEGEG